MKSWMCASLFICSLLMGCYPRPDWSDKDVDFLISKLESWNYGARSRAVWYLTKKTEERDKVITALTHVEVRSETARALGYMEPPAAEAVPALIEAVNLPENDRGKPMSGLNSDLLPLPMAAEEALKSIGTPEALEAIEEYKTLGTKLIESSVPDGASGVNADFINQNGITLRFSADRKRYCRMLTADGTTIWRQPVSGNTVTFKPEPDDPKLVSGSVYTLQVGVTDHWRRYSQITITFTTKP